MNSKVKRAAACVALAAPVVSLSGCAMVEGMVNDWESNTAKLKREVVMSDGSAICVCDGGSDELVQVSPGDDACEKFEDA